MSWVAARSPSPQPSDPIRELWRRGHRRRLWTKPGFWDVRLGDRNLDGRARTAAVRRRGRQDEDTTGGRTSSAVLPPQPPRVGDHAIAAHRSTWVGPKECLAMARDWPVPHARRRTPGTAAYPARLRSAP